MTEPERKPLLSVERQFETDLATGTTQVRMFVKLYFEARDSGLLADIGDRRWRTLCCLATYMDEKGSCYPSQGRIARDLGISRQRVNERIQELLRYRFEGRAVIQLEKRRVRTAAGERWASNVYQILPIAGLGMFGERKPVSGNPDTGHRPVSGKPDTGNPDTNKNQLRNENTHGVHDPESSEPRALVLAFHVRLGRPQQKPTEKEIHQAKALLATHGAGTARFIVEHAIAKARETRFAMRHFGAVLGYVEEGKAAHRKVSQHAIREQHTMRRAEEEKDRLQYQAWRDGEVARLLAESSTDQREAMEAVTRERVRARHGKNPLGFETLCRIELDRLVAERNGVLDFEGWRSGPRSRAQSLRIESSAVS